MEEPRPRRELPTRFDFPSDLLGHPGITLLWLMKTRRTTCSPGVSRRSTPTRIGSWRRRESSGRFVGSKLRGSALGPLYEKPTYRSAERRRPFRPRLHVPSRTALGLARPFGSEPAGSSSNRLAPTNSINSLNVGRKVFTSFPAMLAGSTSASARPPETGVRTPPRRDRPRCRRFPGERVRDTSCEACEWLP